MWVEKARLGASKMWLRRASTRKKSDWTSQQKYGLNPGKYGFNQKEIGFNEQNRWFNVAQKTLNWATRMGEWLPNTKFTQITELHNHEREITNQPKCRTSASMDRGPVTTGELPHDLTDTSNGSGWCKDGNNQILSGVSTGQNRSKWVKIWQNGPPRMDVFNFQIL